MYKIVPLDSIRDAPSFQPLNAFHNTLKKHAHMTSWFLYTNILYKYTRLDFCTHTHTHSEMPHNIYGPTRWRRQSPRSCTVHNTKVIRASNTHRKNFEAIEHCVVSCGCGGVVHLFTVTTLVCYICIRYWNGNFRWNHLVVRKGESDYVESFRIRYKMSWCRFSILDCTERFK